MHWVSCLAIILVACGRPSVSEPSVDPAPAVAPTPPAAELPAATQGTSDEERKAFAVFASRPDAPTDAEGLARSVIGGLFGDDVVPQVERFASPEGGERVRITLEQTGQKDDSVEGIRASVTLDKADCDGCRPAYALVSIQKLYRCQPGRGTGDWQVKWCN